MTYYNVSGLWNMTGAAQIFSYADQLSGNLLGPLIVLAVGMILFFVLIKRGDVGSAFAISSFVAAVLAVLGWAAGFVAGSVVVFVVLAFAGSLFMVRRE